MKNNNYIIYLLLLLVFSSCWVKQQIIESLDNEIVFSNPKTIPEIAKKVNDHFSFPEWTSFKGKINIKQKNQEMTFNINILIKKDSVVWGSIKAPLGIEMFRFMLTPDTVYILNRIAKTIQISEFSRLKAIIKNEINYFQIQETLFGSPKITEQKTVDEYVVLYEDEYIVLESQNKKYKINPLTFRVERFEIGDLEGEKIDIIFSDGDKSSSYFYWKRIDVNVISEDIFSVSIGYKNAIFDKKELLKFKVPKN